MSRAALVAAAVWAGCLPQTDLQGPAPAGAPPIAQAVQLVEPTPGAVAPRNLAAVVLRLPAALRGEAVVQLRPADGDPVTSEAGAALDCTGRGPCYAFPLSAPIPPGRYQVASPAGAVLDDGRPLPAAPAGAFQVQPELDAEAPVVEPPLVETVGDCLRARFATDEPARASLVVRAGGIEQALAAGEGSTLFDVSARFARLPAGAPGELVARAVDWAGNRGEASPLPVVVPATVPPIAITEVLPNPAGPEATQEFVELRNVGTAPLSLEGLTIEDSGGADPLPAVTLEPGQYAVVVAAAFDPLDSRDPAPRGMLLRVEGRIGRDGISNFGEAVRLRGRDGQVLSRYGGWVDAGASGWTGRSVQRQPQDACDGPAAWSSRPQVPTPGW
jgi:Lamin Tail Domain